MTEKIDFTQLKKKYFKPRPKAANKGDFGHVAVIGGDVGMAGAVRMAGEAALRVGAGLTSVITWPEHGLLINAMRPELMTPLLLDSLAETAQRATVLAVGPGLGRLVWGQHLFEKSLLIDKPKILDADALWFLSQDRSPKNNGQDNWILTPHPKEAAQLLGLTVEAVQADRIQAVQRLQKQYRGIAVLKGAGTLVCASPDDIYVCKAGNPGMASGGMGDVLTGVIAGLVAQGLPLLDAACLGVVLHAKAGDRCVEQSGERGLLASDLLSEIRWLINS